MTFNATLGSLHDVIQRAFGWSGEHMHVFEDGSRREYGPPEGSEKAFFGTPDEESVSLADVAPRVGDRIDYTYDFGDDWVHRITVEKVLPSESSERTARCLGGRRADPPAEDIGGAWGMEIILAMLADPNMAPDDNESEERLEGHRERGYDPAAFEPRKVDRALATLMLRRPNPAGERGKDRRDLGRLINADLTQCSCGDCWDGGPDGGLEPRLLPPVAQEVGEAAAHRREQGQVPPVTHHRTGGEPE